jgi:hypothetical protein
VVEHNLAKVGVASSNLVSRSFRRRSQVAKAEVCKTSIHRFDSDRRLSQWRSRLCRGGGIGRRKGLKIPRTFKSVPVRFRPSAHIENPRYLKSVTLKCAFFLWAYDFSI